MTGDKHGQWQSAIYDVADCGFMTEPSDFGPNVYAVSPSRHGWAAVARELAYRLPGQLQTSANGVNWQVGRESKGRLIHVKSVTQIIAARDIHRAIVPISDGKSLKFSVGGTVREILAWVATAQEHDKGAETMACQAYHDCRPGFYDDVTMLDCKACYFSIISMLPSLRCFARLGNEPEFWDFTEEEAGRWADVKEAIKDAKVIRNSLWGAMRGSKEGRIVYCQDKAKGLDSDGKPYVKSFQVWYGSGPFRPAALVVERAAAEMCAIASEEVDSVYSTSDSVTCHDSKARVPQVWQDMGFRVVPKVRGDWGHICAIGTWSVGGIASGHYRNLHLGYSPVARYTIESDIHKSLLCYAK